MQAECVVQGSCGSSSYQWASWVWSCSTMQHLCLWIWRGNMLRRQSHGKKETKPVTITTKMHCRTSLVIPEQDWSLLEVCESNAQFDVSSKQMLIMDLSCTNHLKVNLISLCGGTTGLEDKEYQQVGYCLDVSMVFGNFCTQCPWKQSGKHGNKLILVGRLWDPCYPPINVGNQQQVWLLLPCTGTEMWKLSSTYESGTTELMLLLLVVVGVVWLG